MRENVVSFELCLTVETDFFELAGEKDPFQASMIQKWRAECGLSTDRSVAALALPRSSFTLLRLTNGVVGGRLPPATLSW